MSRKFEATVDGIRFLYDGGEVEVDYNASNDDVVRLTIEPLEVKVTDGFRAAVKKACNCDSSSGGGSTGGGVLVVHADPVTGALDKTWNEISSADFAVLEVAYSSPDGVCTVAFANVAYKSLNRSGECGVGFCEIVAGDDSVNCVLHNYVADSADGYPVLQGSSGSQS